ncbi:MAG: hypothetical protein M3Q48_03235 [Actinomycetota bacterium]|nr:hypothetical protein [Actinomycetota bacterium]
MRSDLVYVRCRSCNRRGVYLVPNRPLLRCKYCQDLRHLTIEEAARVGANLQVLVASRAEERWLALDSHQLAEQSLLQ